MPGTTLDIGQSTIFLVYSEVTPVSQIGNLLARGYAGGSWLGTVTESLGAITSDFAQAGAPGQFAIGYADWTSHFVPGQPANTVVLRTTLTGDVNPRRNRRRPRCD